jgi:hypothetical protein
LIFLKLVGSDIVLEVDWMKRFSPISFFYFVELSLLFKKDGKEVLLRGMTEEAELKFISAEKVYKFLK